MKFNLKQKQLIISGFILILLSPVITWIGTPILSGALCTKNDSYDGVCEGFTGLFYVWAPLMLVPLIIGAVLIAIAFLRKQ